MFPYDQTPSQIKTGHKIDFDPPSLTLNLNFGPKFTFSKPFIWKKNHKSSIVTFCGTRYTNIWLKGESEQIYMHPPQSVWDKTLKTMGSNVRKLYLLNLSEKFSHFRRPEIQDITILLMEVLTIVI